MATGRPFAVLLLLTAAAAAHSGGRGEPPAPPRPVSLVLWCEDGTAGVAALAGRLAREFTAGRPGAGLRVETRDPLSLADELAAASRTGSAPDMVWAGWGAVPVLAGAGLVVPVDGLFDLRAFAPVTVAPMRSGTRRWGVPVSAGGLLLLLANRDLVRSLPSTTDELLAACSRFAAGAARGLAWNRAEPYWAVPWIHGFRGRLLDERGVPSLGTRQMADALLFLADLASAPGAAPAADSYEAGRLFEAGAVAMIVDGDWSLERYRTALGGKLAAARLPRVSATGEWPRPYVSGTCLMLTPAADGERMTAARAFVGFVTGKEKQLDLARALPQLPARADALADPAVSGDLLRGAAAKEMESAEPLPEGAWMRCAWRAMKAELPAVLDRRVSAEEGAAAMQRDADGCAGAR